MKARILLAVLCLLAFTAVVAYAETINITERNYAALGWTKTTRLSKEGAGYVRLWQRRDTTPPYTPSVELAPRGADSTHFPWAGLSTSMFAGRDAYDITYFHLRTCGFEGDGGSWQPPTVRIVFYNGANGYRSCTYLPWLSNPRGTPWTFYDYDLLDPYSVWEEYIQGYPQSNWFNLMNKYSESRFCTDAEVAYEGTPGGQSFMVASGCRDTHEVQYYSSARGQVDYVDIGFADGTFYRLDFGVPEYALNNRSAKDTIIGASGAVGRYANHVIFGYVLADPPPGSGYFYVNDGSNTLVKVNATGYTATIGQYIRAAGFLYPAPTPAELGCSASNITVLVP